MDYKVRWEIDVDADDPVDAAIKAREMQREYMVIGSPSSATVFDVFEDVIDSGPMSRIDLSDVSECQNCGLRWTSDELEPITGLLERVAPGEPMPSGQCSSCGALCQPIT
jgi:hypothetical protein